MRSEVDPGKHLPDHEHTAHHQDRQEQASVPRQQRDGHDDRQRQADVTAGKTVRAQLVHQGVAGGRTRAGDERLDQWAHAPPCGNHHQR
ncbi:hypothetical protein GCM10010486_01390 [Nonomuraea roseoviolacea subsp. carminata]